jgi:hypothetical protein
MAAYLRFHTFRRTQPDVNSSIFEKLMEGFSEVKGGYNSKVNMVHASGIVGHLSLLLEQTVDLGIHPGVRGGTMALVEIFLSGIMTDESN